MRVQLSVRRGLYELVSEFPELYESFQMWLKEMRVGLTYRSRTNACVTPVFACLVSTLRSFRGPRKKVGWRHGMHEEARGGMGVWVRMSGIAESEAAALLRCCVNSNVLVLSR